MKSLKPIGTILVIVIIAVTGIWYSQRDSSVPTENVFGTAPGMNEIIPVDSAYDSYEKIDIETPKGKMAGFVANTPALLEMGLSGKESLPKNSGMLFVPDEPGMHGFWMQNMKFPLTIVWLDEFKRVVGISKNLSPDTYPDVFYPPTEVLYILEINPGDDDVHGMATGTVLKF